MLRSLNERVLEVEDARRLARRRLPHGLFEYIDRGVGGEISVQRNRASLDAVRLSPSVLIDVTTCATDATILGRPQPSPLIIAPTAAAGLVWYDGEIELAKAAARHGIPFCVATQSITPIERIAAGSGAELWFQLYVWKDRERTFSLIDRAWAAGAKALLLTVDTAVPPKRDYNVRNGFGVPLKLSARAGLDVLSRPRWASAVMLRTLARSGVPSYIHYPKDYRTRIGRDDPASPLSLATDVTWEDVRRLRDRWKGKLVLKGVLRAEDALTAARYGVDAVVVSNHGGRNLDCAPGPVDVLPSIAAAVKGRLEVLADSGVRRGTDVARFLALGAQGVLIGRATLFGLAVGGAEGASRILDILIHELKADMGFLGSQKLSEIRLA